MRDRLLLLLTAAVVAVVLAGYAWAAPQGASYKHIQFGLTAVSPAGAPAFLKSIDPTSRLGRVVAGYYQARAKTFLRNRLIGFDRLMLSYSDLITGANRWFYATVLPDQSVVPVGVDSSEVFLDKAEDSLVYLTLGSDAQLQLEKVNAADAGSLVRSFPGVNFAYYGVTSWTMTDRAKQAGYRDPAAEAWVSFARDVQPGSAAGSLAVADWSDVFFRTDHHWVPPGAYQGYLDVMQLLSRGNPRIGSARLPFGERTVPGIDFRGANSRRAAYLPISEPFRVLTTRDPAVHAYLDGRLDDTLIAPADPFAKASNALFLNHYAIYNGQDYALMEYRTGRTGAGNLLLFADSFSNSMDDLVASHFGTTYKVDLRDYQPETGKPFDVAAFIADHGITDVLFLGRPVRVMSMPTALRRKRPIR